MYIKRDFESVFGEILRSNKILVVYGSRQTGKTTIIEHLLEDEDIRAQGIVLLNGDVKGDRELLAYESMTAEKAHAIIGDAKMLFVDERGKNNDARRIKVLRYFWRLATPSDGEIDYVEELPSGELRAYEFKYSSQQAKKAKCPSKFAKAYPEASWAVVSRENYVGFINGEF